MRGCGYDQTGRLDDVVAEQQQVEVDRPWAGRGRCRVAAEGSLDLEQAVEQGPGIEAGFDGRRGVEEVRVGGRYAAFRYGLGGVETRNGGHAPELAQANGRGAQISLSAAQVRAEGDEGARPAHGRQSTSAPTSAAPIWRAAPGFVTRTRSDSIRFHSVEPPAA